MSHEQRHGEGPGADFGRNSPFDLGILREHLRNTLEASEILGEDDEKRPGWRRILENLAPCPVSEGGYLTEWEGIELDNSHRHFSHLYPIFPGEDIHQGSDPEDLQVGRLSLKRTIERGFERYVGFSFGWLACVAARVGEGDTALELIQDHIRSFVNVNAFSVIGDSRHPVFGKGYFSPRRGPDWQGVSLLNMESGSGLAAAINELLLCSPRGTIRVFPALPKEWSDVRFSRLRAQGAFLVTSEVRAGRICYVLLESEAGSECRLANPWPGESVVVRNGQGRQVRFRVRGQQIRFDTKAGEHYVVCPEAIAPSDLEMVVVTGDAGAIPRFGIGGSFERLIAERGWQPARPR
jgi:alpha-L-fucosidase 2